MEIASLTSTTITKGWMICRTKTCGKPLMRRRTPIHYPERRGEKRSKHSTSDSGVTGNTCCDLETDHEMQKEKCGFLASHDENATKL